MVEISIGILVLVVAAISFSAIGIFFSSLFKRTLVATVSAYALAIVVIFGIPLFSIIGLAVFGELIFANNLEHLSVPMRTILLIGAWLIVSLSPVATIIGSEIILLDQQSALYASLKISNNFTLHLVSPWILYIMIYTLLSVIMLMISIRLVKRLEK
jgi:hypothetical protein